MNAATAAAAATAESDGSDGYDFADFAVTAVGSDAMPPTRCQQITREHDHPARSAKAAEELRQRTKHMRTMQQRTTTHTARKHKCHDARV